MSSSGDLLKNLTDAATGVTQTIIKHGGAALGDMAQGGIEAAVALPLAIFKRFAGDDPEAQAWGDLFAKPPEMLSHASAQLVNHGVKAASELGGMAVGAAGHGLDGLITKIDRDKTNELG